MSFLEFAIKRLRSPTRSESKKVLFLFEKGDISETQIAPYFLLPELVCRKYSVRDFLQAPLQLGPADVVCFQTWFNFTDDEMRESVAKIRRFYPAAKLLYFDWFAATDLRYANVLVDLVDIYVRKQTFVNFEDYQKTTLGETNLTNYFARRYNLEFPPQKLIVPDAMKSKIVLGTSFEFASHIFRRAKRQIPNGDRPIDLHARIAASGGSWYSAMRSEAVEAVADLSKTFNINWKGRVSQREFMDELQHSKLCFSPFGYGEVCWRDFEAWVTGSMLLKPDMSHLRLREDPFVPYETYVPLRWDLSDLEEKMRYYLAHPQDRRRIAEAAFLKVGKMLDLPPLSEHASLIFS